MAKQESKGTKTDIILFASLRGLKHAPMCLFRLLIEFVWLVTRNISVAGTKIFTKVLLVYVKGTVATTCPMYYVKTDEFYPFTVLS